MRFNWQLPDWPHFRYDLAAFDAARVAYARFEGRLQGLREALPDGEQREVALRALVLEALKTSAIEGELLAPDDIVASVRQQLGWDPGAIPVRDARARGIAEVVVQVRETTQEPLTEALLFAWHAALLGSEADIAVGKWRTHPDPMRIVSGPMGREVVHFEAPPSQRVPEEMARFLIWFNSTRPGGPEAIDHPPVRAALAHLYFESIHPFEDGNGRIGRALAEKVLSEASGMPMLLGLSAVLERKRKAYYAALHRASLDNDVQDWCDFFVPCVLEAIERSCAWVGFSVAKSRWYAHFGGQLSPRAAKVIARMFSAGPEGFEGGMTAAKYMRIAGTSKATATRDLAELAASGALAREQSGRNTRYRLTGV